MSEREADVFGGPMQYSEDSVVVALDEVRRLRHRSERGHGRNSGNSGSVQRARQESYGEPRQTRPQPAAIQSAPDGYGDAMGGAWASSGGGSAAVAARAWAEPAPAFAMPDVAGTPSPDYQALAAAAGLRKSGGAGRVFVMLLVFGAIGGGGYLAYQEHLAAQATIAAKDAALARAEEGARQATEERSRAERQAATKIAALEERLAAAEARAMHAAPVPAAAAPVAPEPAKAEPAAVERPTSRHARAAEAKASKRSRAVAKVEAKAEEKPTAKTAKSMKIAPKRSLSDDPLAGLKLR